MSLGGERNLDHARRSSALQGLDARLGALIEWGVARVLRAPSRVALGFAVTCALALAFAVPRLGVDSDEQALFESDVRHAKLRERFGVAFPALIDPLLVVIDAATIDRGRDAALEIERRLRAEPALFPTVFAPGSSPFFETHGLLYLDTEELAELTDRLAELQPFLGTLARDPSLRGLFELLADASDAAARGEFENEELARFLEEVAASVRAVERGERRELPWAEILLGRPATSTELRRLVVVQPRVDYAALEPAGETLHRLREILAETGATLPDVELRVTGVYALSQEESQYVTSQAGAAGAAAFVLVALVLAFGLRSARIVFCVLGALLAGLALTAGFAALAVGRLNLISVAFAVLCVGLGVDFGIHLCIRYRTHLARGEPRPEALTRAAREVGGSLVVCAATTAIAFYAFVPTGFVGIAELGLIAGTGMFFCLAVNLTLLPALLALGPPPREREALRPPGEALRSVLGFPVRHARATVAVTGLLALAALPALRFVEFDGNPLNVRDPNTESVQTYEDLLADGMAFPWNLHAVAESREAAVRLAERLEALPAVKSTRTLDDYVPTDQPEKLALLDEAAFLLLPTLDPAATLAPPSFAEEVRALDALEQSLGGLAQNGDHPELAAPARALREALASLRSGLDGGAAAKLDALQTSLLRTLPVQLDLLRGALTVDAVQPADLPEELRRQLVTPDGRVRVEVFPKEDLGNSAALARYITSVIAVAPNAYGEALAILDIAHIVVDAFRQALVTASVLILLALYAMWRNAVDTALVALPLALAALFTAAASVATGVPFNFANVIVIPLLLGMGVDSGIHLVHRIRYEDAPGANLLYTDTARAVLVSGLTTIASFAALGFTTHLGLASLGRLLTLGMVLILLCNLVVLPAVVALTGLAARSERSPANVRAEASPPPGRA